MLKKKDKDKSENLNWKIYNSAFLKSFLCYSKSFAFAFFSRIKLLSDRHSARWTSSDDSSSNAHTTAKQVISHRELDESNGDMYKNEKTKTKTKKHLQSVQFFFYFRG